MAQWWRACLCSRPRVPSPILKKKIKTSFTQEEAFELSCEKTP
jgi:hypothetical protein